MNIEKVTDLRDKLNSLPDAAAVYYWYADKQSLESILARFDRRAKLIDEIKKTCAREIGGKEYFLIYVGTTRNRGAGLRQRLKWHIANKHTRSAIGRGTLSTLRQSISSLVAGNWAAEGAVNKTLDRMLVGYETFPSLELGAPATKRLIEDKERELLDDFHPIINIQCNYPETEIGKAFKSFLSRLRKSSKAAALNGLDSL